jgi:hypothetical protein
LNFAIDDASPVEQPVLEKVIAQIPNTFRSPVGGNRAFSVTVPPALKEIVLSTGMDGTEVPQGLTWASLW